MLTDYNFNIIDRVPGWMNRNELEYLAKRAALSKSWLEVGVFCGRSLLCVGLHLPKGARLYGVDIALGDQRRAGQDLFDTYKHLVNERKDLQIVLVRGDSRLVCDLFDKVDTCFIDAGHEYECTKKEIEQLSPKADFLCGHDYCKSWPGVMKAVDELLPDAKHGMAGSIWER